MSFKLCFLVLALLLTSALGSKDPELKKCKQQCKVQAQYDEKEAKKCIQQYCQDRGEHANVKGGAEDRLNKCDKGCMDLRLDDQAPCFDKCFKDYLKEKDKEEGERHEGNPSGPPFEYEVCHEECTKESLSADWKCERKCEKLPENDERERKEREEEGQNPYVFEDRHFFTGWKTEHGNLRILKKFTERSEKLFRGIENFRLAVIEARPQTFLVPNHWDADGVLFVANGKGTVSLVHQEGRESFNVKEGDIFRIKAGTTTYWINSDNNEKLVIVELVRPVNTPGEFEAFYGAGGENPESFYRAFSDEILEAAFNVRSDKLEKIFGQQKQGEIIKASEEQIKGMSGQTEGSIWPFGGESKGSSKHSLYEERSAQTNQYGQLYEIDPDKFSLLKDLDVSIYLANISKGAMTAPNYNSRATRISIVVGGEGYFEMACPHLSRSAGRSRAETGYRKIRSNLKVGTTVVIPAGHPVVAVASDNQNLQLLCFEINTYNNRKYTLAGKANVMKQLEKEAKELAFGVAAREVDEVFNRQKEEYFLKGPRQQHQGRADA